MSSDGHRVRRSLLLLASAALVGLVTAACESTPAPPVGEPAPDFELPDLDGSPHRLSEWRGRVVVLNFWATWCPPCIDEMPSLQSLHRALSDKGLAILAVSADERFRDIEEFVETYDIEFTVLHDEGKKVSRRYQTFMYPETYIIDRSGRLRSKVVGPRDWVAPTVIRDLVALLQEEEREGEEPRTTTEGDARSPRMDRAGVENTEHAEMREGKRP